MKTPSAEEIDAEIKTLREMKPTVLRSSAFGDNHHDAIDCQITVLEKRMTESAIYDRNEGAAEDEEFYADNERDAALDACRWMNGESDEKPSEGWKELVH